jgi:short-subunit dehydrogenase
VTSLPTLTNTFADVVRDFGQIDGCITAAGIVLSKPFIEHEWDETMKIKLVNVRQWQNPKGMYADLETRIWGLSSQHSLQPSK